MSSIGQMTEELRGRGRPSRDAVLASLDRAVADLEAVGGLPRPAEAEEIWKGIWYEEVHNSTAIEGNTLVLKEVQLLLEEGRAVGDKGAARVPRGPGIRERGGVGLRSGS